jgi:hypothetical protein
MMRGEQSSTLTNALRIVGERMRGCHGCKYLLNFELLARTVASFVGEIHVPVLVEMRNNLGWLSMNVRK